MNTRLQRICRLEPVAHTLTRLCLADQELTKLEALCLPHLRHLSLADEHYGTNPITAETGYKIFVVNQLKQELLGAFRALEDVVTKGRKAMADEHARHQLMREKHTTALHHKLQSLQQDYLAQLDSLITQSDALFELLERRAVAEEEQALAVAQLQTSATTFHHVADSSPDFRYIASLFVGLDPSEAGQRTDDDVDWKVLQLYKCHTSLRQQPFSPDGKPSPSVPLFLAGQAALVHSFFTDNVLPPSSWLASDPAIATIGHADHCHMLVCHVASTVQVHEVHVEGGAWDEQLLVHTERHATLWTKVHFHMHSRVTSVVYLPPAAPSTSCPSTVDVIPVYYAVCAATPCTVDEAELQRLLHDAGHPPSVGGAACGTDKDTADALLQQCQARMRKEVEAYQRHLWDDLQPDRIRVPEDVQSLQQALDHLRSHIQEEQDTQVCTHLIFVHALTALTELP
ncbi:hypothetical protein DYB30_006037 [Aphanomyces astaci]|uniref:Uncharacterized protein n=1 Tax=Aphanomyces astaci TaxID=112090 RepID=A0A397EDD1_APHAT|nr:hypothetical protein DYB36_001705 [Aphanomyces astaci]RHY42277.1 hypothetical protein DYB30_006037 [Aphanomyces astaci]RHY60583.1 hypothetical protein DYB34_002759 [Aphanomyces astaci]RHY76667.1 hypothetical protein DYB38_002242 [Aphanomyces astaci]